MYTDKTSLCLLLLLLFVIVGYFNVFIKRFTNDFKTKIRFKKGEIQNL